MRTIAKNFSLLLVTCTVLFAAFEIALRGYRHIYFGEELFRTVGYRYADETLGWQGKTWFGDLSTKKPRVFIVGDSFTGMNIAGRRNGGGLYHRVMQDQIDAELFVFGGGGFGTLQEYLAIDRHIDEIKPDLLLLQVCSNDFINNSWALEKKSFRNNNYRVRPYLENDEIVYRHPRGDSFVRHTLMPYSYGIYFILSRTDRFLAKQAQQGGIQTVELDIEAQGLQLPEFRQARDTTQALIRKIKQRAGTVPVYAFPVIGNEPYLTQFKEIFSEEDIPFFSEVPRIAWDAELATRSRPVLETSHWTEVGHLHAGRYLAKQLQQELESSQLRLSE